METMPTWVIKLILVAMALGFCLGLILGINSKLPWSEAIEQALYGAFWSGVVSLLVIMVHETLKSQRRQ